MIGPGPSGAGRTLGLPVASPRNIHSLEQTVDMVVTVKAYPVVSQRYREAVCVAGVRTDTPTPEWVRLFPVCFRDLPEDRQFAKYQRIRLQTLTPRSDRRPETRTPLLDTIETGEILDTSNRWGRRMELFEPLRVESMCELVRRQHADGTSLGIFRPRDVTDLKIAPANDWTPKQRMILEQPSLMDAGRAKAVLEKPALSITYHYRCSDPACKGHKQQNVDWEFGQAVRQWGPQASGSADLERMIREMWLEKMCAATKDTHFVVGSQHQYPDKFLILSVVWPAVRPQSAQLGLFDLAA
jgi:hypothetical protein